MPHRLVPVGVAAVTVPILAYATTVIGKNQIVDVAITSTMAVVLIGCGHGLKRLIPKELPEGDT